MDSCKIHAIYIVIMGALAALVISMFNDKQACDDAVVQTLRFADPSGKAVIDALQNKDCRALVAKAKALNSALAK